MFPLVKSEKITDMVESWVTISSVKTEPSDEKGSTVLRLTTDNTEIGNIDLILTQRENGDETGDEVFLNYLMQLYQLHRKPAEPILRKHNQTKASFTNELPGLKTLAIPKLIKL